MNGFDIITAFAIILCARLGIRLFTQYKKMKQEDNEEASEDEKPPQS